MINDITALGAGIVGLAITIGAGTLVLAEFGSAVASCNTTSPYNVTTELCQHTTNASDTFNPSVSTQTTNYLGTELGQAGLAGWVPAIVALMVGLGFMGMFFIGRGNRKGRY